MPKTIEETIQEERELCSIIKEKYKKFGNSILKEQMLEHRQRALWLEELVKLREIKNLNLPNKKESTDLNEKEKLVKIQKIFAEDEISKESVNSLPDLPCKIGDDVYKIPSKINYELNILSGRREANKIYHQKIERITLVADGWFIECSTDIEYTGKVLSSKFFKETWFLSKPEASKKLQEMEQGVF